MSEPVPVFVDANVPIYAAGRSHPLKEPCARFLAEVAERPEIALTDAEVLQELLHRYLGVRDVAVGLRAFDAFAALMHGRVVAVDAVDVAAARAMADEARERLSARDLLHAAVMRRRGCDTIISADHAFDTVPGIRRLDPGRWPAWRDELRPAPGRG